MTGYNDELDNNSNGLKSGWPDLPAVKKRKTREFYRVDVNNTTVAKGDDRDFLANEARRLGGVLHRVEFTEENRQEEATIRRKRRAIGDFQA